MGIPILSAGLDLPELSGDPAAPSAGVVKLYAKAAGFYAELPDSTVIGPFGPGGTTSADVSDASAAGGPTVFDSLETILSAMPIAVGFGAVVSDADYDLGALFASISAPQSSASVAVAGLSYWTLSATRTVTLPQVTSPAVAINEARVLIADLSGDCSPTKKIRIVCASTDVIYNGPAGPTSTEVDITTPYGFVDLMIPDGGLGWIVMGPGAAERAASSSTPAAIGTAAAGTGTTDARSDHVHATGAGTPSTQAFGDSAATGTGPAASMTDHKHAMPALPAIDATGAATDITTRNASTTAHGLLKKLDNTATHYMDGTGAWSVPPASVTYGVAGDYQPPGTAGAGAVGKVADSGHSHPENPGFFGDGSDGAITLQQTTSAPAWASKSGSGATTTFALTRDVYATTFDMDDSAGNYLVKTAGFRIFASVSHIIDAGVTVHYDGNNASGATAGAVMVTGTLTAAAGAGSAGAVNTTAAQAGSTSPSAAAVQGASNVASGGAGGASSGGGTGGGVAGGVMSNAAGNGSPRNLVQALRVGQPLGSSLFAGGGGGTGGNATGGSSATGGGGGSGGGIVAIYARLLTNNGTIRAAGGIGGNAAIGNGSGAGGGGGGGGGAVILVYGAGSTVGTATAPGGSGGSLAGAGAAGATGSSGIVYQLQV